jgi:hypothetical protein
MPLNGRTVLSLLLGLGASATGAIAPTPAPAVLAQVPASRFTPPARLNTEQLLQTLNRKDVNGALWYTSSQRRIISN